MLTLIGSVMLIAFIYVNVVRGLSNNVLPPGFTASVEIVEIQKLEQGVPVFGATLRTPQLNNPAVHSGR